jgi:hypothetical protein
LKQTILLPGVAGERLGVVDDRREPVEAADGRERRPRRDRAAQALDTGQQRRLLTDDVGAGALEHRDVEGEAAAVDAIAEEAASMCVRDGRQERRL